MSIGRYVLVRCVVGVYSASGFRLQANPGFPLLFVAILEFFTWIGSSREDFEAETFDGRSLILLPGRPRRQGGFDMVRDRLIEIWTTRATARTRA
eukprot:6181176-Pleurochrysis_carterae.AAC.1